MSDPGPDSPVNKTPNSFVLGRLHSLVGLVPLGAFVVYHFWLHAHSLQGPAVYDRKLAELYDSPLHLVFSITLVYLPLLYHSVYGLLISKRAHYNFLQYGWLRNWTFTLQRASGVGLLLFIPAHLVKARFSQFFLNEPMSFAHEADGLRHALTIIVYAAGILGASFHLANGVFTFGLTWGIWVSPDAQKRAGILSYLVFAVLTAMGLGAMLGFM